MTQGYLSHDTSKIKCGKNTFKSQEIQTNDRTNLMAIKCRQKKKLMLELTFTKQSWK